MNECICQKANFKVTYCALCGRGEKRTFEEYWNDPGKPLERHVRRWSDKRRRVHNERYKKAVQS